MQLIIVEQYFLVVFFVGIMSMFFGVKCDTECELSVSFMLFTVECLVVFSGTKQFSL